MSRKVANIALHWTRKMASPATGDKKVHDRLQQAITLAGLGLKE